MAKDYNVTIIERGRFGSVRYSEGWWRNLEFHWEFGGGDAIAMIRIPTADEWKSQPRWVADRRDEVLERVAHEVCRQRCPNCRVRMTDMWIELVESRSVA